MNVLRSQVRMLLRFERSVGMLSWRPEPISGSKAELEKTLLALRFRLKVE